MRIALAVATVVILLASLATLAVRTGQVSLADPTAASGAGPAAAGPAARPAPPTPTPTPTQPPDYTDLRRRISRMLDRPAQRLDGQLSIAVRDGEGRAVFDRASTRPRLPASTIKLVTAAVALNVFAPDHRFTTTVETAGRVDAGVLRGDLVLRGSGDPVLATPSFGRWVAPDRPRTELEQLAKRVAAAGIETVAGDLVADTSLIGGDLLAEGWDGGYLAGFHARRIRALTVDAGLAVGFEGAPSAQTVVVHQARDPALQAGVALEGLLQARGVNVQGRVRVVTTPRTGQRRLAGVSSPPLERLLRHMIRESDNHLADTLIRAAAATAGYDGSWASAGEVARDTLAALGVDPRGFRLADGSGLSRRDRVTAAQLAELDAAVADSRYATLWRRLKAVAGETGTLEKRLVDTVAEGEFHGKTGTLSDVTAIAGSVHGPDGARYHLAAIGNGVAGEKAVARRAMDQLVLLLAEDQRGCVRRPRPAGGYRLRCAST